MQLARHYNLLVARVPEGLTPNTDLCSGQARRYSLPNMVTPPILAEILARLTGDLYRTGSIVITIYGDAVVPRGGSLWLGTLLDIFRTLDIGDGVVRTAMSRLATDGWLDRTRRGRNSFYRLAEKGRTTFQAATERIYRSEPPVWDGSLTLVLLDGGDDRTATRTALEAAGFGSFGPGVLVAIKPDVPVPESNGGIFVTGQAGDIESARRLAARAWPLAAIAERYIRFIDTFRPIEREMRDGPPLDGLTALILRVLLIHEYRRVILRDPLLPAPLLPDDWPGHAARRLCASIYLSLVAPSEAWLDAHGRNETGPLPPPAAEFGRRFQDLA
jgi:phenylacetic acid degradation operon negative regulatory protein